MKIALLFAVLGTVASVACASPTSDTEGDDSSSSALSGSGTSFVARGTGYFPDGSAMEGGFVDRKGVKLHTLQQFLAGQAPYVSVAMDVNAFSYGQRLRIHELNTKYGQDIVFKVVDTGGAFKGKGKSRIDICTANNKASLDPTINGTLHIDAIAANAPAPAPTTPPAPTPAPAGDDDDDDSTTTSSSSSSSGSTGGGATCSNDGMCNPGNDGSGLICVSHQCVPGCHSDAQCPGSTSCGSDGQCE